MTSPALHETLEERTVGGLHDFLEVEVSRMPRSSPVLDIGCGSGAWLDRLGRLGFADRWGIDAGPQPIARGMRFIRADLDSDDPALDGMAFGLVTAIEVIEHLENPGRLVSFISRHLQDDARVLITTPNIHSLRCRLKLLLTGRLPSFDEKGDPTHIAPLLLPAFRKVAGRHGLEIERVWTYPPEQTRVFGRAISIASAALRVFVSDPLPGDTLCIMLRRAQ
jgi:SAM-dependent methyltransferase